MFREWKCDLVIQFLMLNVVQKTKSLFEFACVGVVVCVYLFVF